MLDVDLAINDINHKQFAYLGGGPIKTYEIADDFPKDKIGQNYVDLILHSFKHEREQVHNHYWKQGLLGRFFLFLFDKLIDSLKISFEMAKYDYERRRVTQSSVSASQSDQSQDPEQRPSKPAFVVHDLERIELLTRIRAIRSLTYDCKQIRKQLQGLLEALEVLDE